MKPNLQRRWPMTRLVSLMCAMLIAAAPLAGSLLAQAQENTALESADDVNQLAASPARPTGNVLTINMSHFKDPDGYRLRTVRTERTYDFTRPKGWKVLPSSFIHLTFQHGPNLLPERSSLNVLVNNRILKTIPLSKSNVMATSMNIAIPPKLLKDHNRLTFQVDQHYTYQCEDPFSEELWTEVLPDTNVTLKYDLEKQNPDLARFPLPHLDPLNVYYTTEVGYIVNPAMSDASLEAFGVVAAHLGQLSGWRKLKPFLADESMVNSNYNLILVGTPGENPAIASVSRAFDTPLSGGSFVDKTTGEVIPADQGVIQLVANPNNPTRAILVVSGNGPQGVKKAAHVLAHNTVNNILVGKSAIIKDYDKGSDYPYRAWDGFIHASGDRFADIGLQTMTSRGVTALPLYYQLKRMPDIYLPGRKKARLHTVYSYSSQLDGKLSNLEVRLNGKAIKSIPLNDVKGKTQAEFTVDIPTEEIFTFNDLEYQFHLFPDKFDLCRFVTDVHIWGTVHNTSSIDFPGEVKVPLPDVGLVNDGGYPFTGYQNMQHTTVVLPENPSHVDLEVMLQFLTRLGRESYSHKGIDLAAYRANTLPGDNKKNDHLVIVGMVGQNALAKELNAKTTLLAEGKWNTLQDDQQKKLAALQYNESQGIVEELLSPWNDKRVVLLLTGETDTALVHTAQLFEKDPWFGAIQPSNLTVVNDEGPKGLILMKKGEAKFLYPQDLKQGFQLPTWAWIAVSFLAVMGLFSVLRFFFGR